MTLLGPGSLGYVPVSYTSSTVVNTLGGTATAGHYALVAGSGSPNVGITAKYVATFTTQPATLQVTGTYVGPAAYGMEIKTAANGIIPIIAGTSTQISGTLSAGATVTVSGTGSVHAAILATSVSTGSSAATSTPTPSAIATPDTATGTISQHHVLTLDYLGTPFGTTSVTASRAAPYLSWASTGVTNTNAMASAGIKTMVYFNVDRLQSTDEMYAMSPSSAFAHTCTGSKVTDYFDNVTQYTMNNGASTLRSVYASFVASKTSGYHVDAVFEDNAVPLSAYATSFFSPGPVCSYSDATWLADERGLEASINHPTIFNGLQAFYNHGLALNTSLLENSSTIGGNLETCYTANSSNPEQTAWVWTATENTELYLGARGKIFSCLAMDTASAPSATRSRLFTIASFLLTYAPSTSMLWENYATPSRLHVMPESQLVPLNPLVATPSSVTGLLQSTGVYAREYRNCYYAGRAIGSCAVVINSDRVSHSAPHLTLAYRHTLNLHGYGVVDSGTATFDGAAPPSALAAASAYVAVP